MGYEETIAGDGQPGVDSSHGLEIDLVMATAMQKMQDLPAQCRCRQIERIVDSPVELDPEVR